MDLEKKILEEGLKHIDDAHLEPIEDEYEVRIREGERDFENMYYDPMLFIYEHV